MTVYYSVIAGLMICFVVNSVLNKRTYSYTIQDRKPTKMISIIIILILALVAGLRYNVGSDFYFYYSNYDYYKTAELQIFNEPGIRILARIAGYLYDDPATLIFLSAVITVVLITVTILRNSEMYWLSILLYIFLGGWAGCFNGIRQYLAVAVLFAGHHYIKERNIWKWLVVVAVASLFHITAIIAVFFYFYPKIKLSFENIFLSILAAFVGIRIYDRIFAFIEFLRQKELIFEGERATYLLNSINPLRIAVAWVPIVFFLIFFKYYDVKNSEFNFYINMSILNACLMTVAMNSAYAGRVGSYTNMYNAIVWPLLLKQTNRQSRAILIFLMILLYMLYWVTEMSKADLATFSWIFQQ